MGSYFQVRIWTEFSLRPGKYQIPLIASHHKQFTWLAHVFFDCFITRINHVIFLNFFAHLSYWYILEPKAK